MSYNAKKQNIAVIALALAAMFIFTGSSYAEEPVAAPQAVVDQPAANQPASEDVLGLDEKTVTESAQPTETPAVTAEEASDNGDFLNAETSEETDLFSDTPVTAPNAPKDSAKNEATAQSEDFGLDEGSVITPPAEESAKEAEAAVEEPKSPFERFGNAILSKVDNDLFNQMSKIEKQTTLLNLEYKREELKNRVETLRAQRRKALEEEDARRRETEKRLKDEETERQAKIIEAEALLKEKEAELEKVRQGKIVNDYMNEMLIMNQKWIERNAELQARIRELEEERQDLIQKFEEKIADLSVKADETKQKASVALASHSRVLASMSTQIDQLRVSLRDSEKRIQQYQSGDNPFADGEGISRDAIDMSEQYAIMDITGKGQDIVAKIVSKDGTTFLVHPGSMLKGGEIVTAITDKYISFDNKGVKSYLYTGGTVLEYEPTLSFNDSDKTPEQTVKKSIKDEVRNVRGQSSSTEKSKKVEEQKAKPVTKPKLGSLSFGQGMFVK